MMKAKHLRVVLALSATAVFGLSACATPDATPKEPIPAEVARRLESARGDRTEFPTFGDIPAAPTNLRTPAQWRAVVGRIEERGERVGSWPRNNPAWITNPEADAAALQARTRLAPDELPRPDQPRRTEAFADTLRARTVPPPRLD